MFRLLKVRPFTTKICLECKNYSKDKCLKIIKNTCIISGKINYESLDIARNTICGVKDPKFFESNLSNMKNDLIKLDSYENKIIVCKIINIFTLPGHLYLASTEGVLYLTSAAGVLFIHGIIFFSLFDLLEKNIRLVQDKKKDIETIENFKPE
jgi:hypothetical protein